MATMREGISPSQSSESVLQTVTAGAGGSRASSGAVVRSPSAPLVPGPGSAASVAAEEPGVSAPVAEGAASVPMAVDGGDSVNTRPFSLFEHADALACSRCPRLHLWGRSRHALPHAAAHLATTLLTLRDLWQRDCGRVQA
jgi:hypothetical protein